MEINNYYKTLTSKQKEKLKERTAFSVYYEWLDQLEAVHLTYEQRGIIFTAIGFYARTNGTEKLPADLAERIESEPLLLFIFNTFMNTTERATKQWINLRSKRKTNKEEEDTSTESPLQCPTMPQDTKEGHDTTPPPENEEDEEKEEIKSYVIATGKYKKDGLSIQEIYEQDPEWIEEMSRNRDPENEVAKKDIEFIREFIKVILNKPIEEDTTSTESPLQCPTMPQKTEEGHDTAEPVESDFRAKNEAIETYGYIMSVNEEEGTLSLEEGDTYTFNPDENPDISDFNEKYVMILHNSKNEIINIEEDTPF